MLNRKIKTSLLVIAVLLGSRATMVLGRGVLETIEVYRGGVRVLVDGEEKTLTDVNGKKVEPMIVDGTTYVPLRGIVELYEGSNVAWNQESRTVLVNTAGTSETEVTDLEKEYEQRKIRAITTVESEDIFQTSLDERPDLAQDYSNSHIKAVGVLKNLDRTRGATIITLANPNDSSDRVRLYVTDEFEIQATNDLVSGETYYFVGIPTKINTSVILSEVYLVSKR